MAKPEKTDREILQEAVAARGVEGLNTREQAIFQKLYGQAYALMTLDPELMRIALQGIEKGWTQEEFTLRFQNSRWFNNRLSGQRMAETFRATSPADYDFAVQQVKDEIRAAAMRAGGATPDEAELDADVAELMKFYNGNIATVIGRVEKYARRKYVGNGAVKFGGEAATNAVNIRSYARSMGYDLSDAEVGTFVDQIFAEENTLENIQNDIRGKAVSMFPQFADRINAGATVEEITLPYRRMLGSLLEIPDIDAIDMSGGTGKIDPLLDRALYATDEKGNPKVMGLWEFRKAIKQDERWQYTANARDEYANIALELMRDFGAGV